MAKMAMKFTKEGDIFLGQKITEVRRVGASQEVWYKLGKSDLTKGVGESDLTRGVV